MLLALMVMPRSRSRSIESSTCALISRWVSAPGQFEQPVGQGGFPVVDVRDDAEIADELRDPWIFGSDRGAAGKEVPGSARCRRVFQNIEFATVIEDAGKSGGERQGVPILGAASGRGGKNEIGEQFAETAAGAR